MNEEQFTIFLMDSPPFIYQRLISTVMHYVLENLNFVG
jgi:hypothetical protein